jgi:serine phosphatase RsbU (regulator of sigma subunit)/sugar lactone lactonase YvrE
MGTYDEGIVKYNFDKAPFELYEFETTTNETKPIAISLAQSIIDPNMIWLGTNKGLYKFDRTDNSIIKSPITSSRISKLDEMIIEDVIETRDRKLFLGTSNNGLFSYDLLNNKSIEIKPDNYSRTSLRFSDINVLLEDSQNRLWIGQDLGLSILNETESKSFIRIPNFENRQYSEDLIAVLHSLRNSKTPLLQIIHVGDFADLTKEFVLSEDKHIFVSGIGEGNRRGGMYDYGMLKTLEGDTLWSMADLDSTFRASGHSKNRQKIGIFKLAKGRYQLHFKTDDSHSVESFNVLPPQDSTYWGIEVYTISDKEFIEFKEILRNDINSTYMNGNVVKEIFESSDKLIWVATTEGLSIIDPKTFSIKNITSDSEDEIFLSSNSVEDICEDDFGNIWIATENGLNKFNRKANIISVYSEIDGLPSSSLKALQMDADGNLWVSTIRGISKVELSDTTQTPIFINYDVRDGLQGYRFIGNASLIDSDNKLYFAGPDGFNAFYPGITDKSLSSIVLNDLSISNKSVDEVDYDLLSSKELNKIEELDLAYDQNDITFEFASIHFARPDKNRLQYKMEGVDRLWHDGSKQIAVYGNLNPGEYVFNIRGSNGDGIWNENIKKINIYISPAWYNNWTAYTVYAFLFLGFLYSIRKFEMGRQEKNAQIKESKLRIETAEALAKAAEADKRALEIEYEHKKKELEEARELQLSMLPKELPKLPNLDIAVYMKTATEVGGDYYDFHIGMDGTLTVVLGDATGHGMKAGTMVTTTKSLFNVLAPNPNIVETFQEMTRCLKLMQMQNLSMCMTMLKIMGNKVQFSSAGMPPVFLYKRENQSTEEHLIKGMPLGTFNNFPYKIVESELNSGDVILLMSDGFPELLNNNKEMFGYKRIRNLFEDLAHESPEVIISKLKNAGSDWVNDKDPDDDVTFVVIKVK